MISSVFLLFIMLLENLSKLLQKKIEKQSYHNTSMCSDHLVLINIQTIFIYNKKLLYENYLS